MSNFGLFGTKQVMCEKNRAQMAVDTKKTVLFLILTFVLSWTIAFVFFALFGSSHTVARYIMAVAYMFMPATVVIIVEKLIYGEPVTKPLRISFRLNRWFLAAWLLPVGFAIATAGTSILMPGAGFTTDESSSRLPGQLRTILPAQEYQQVEKGLQQAGLHPFWIGLAGALVAGVTINAVAAFGEELGWRGFLQNQLMPMGFWKSSLVIGLIWGIWHAPLVLHGHNYPDHPITGVFMMTVFCTLLGPIFSFVTIRANSVIAAAIIHGSLNAAGGLPLCVIEGGNDLTTGITGLSGFTVLVLLNLILLAYGHRPSIIRIRAGYD
jgi:membrane protease YdiL (CAAX protease family)